jgi:plastocyanin
MRSTYLGVLVAALFAISACGGGTSPSSNPAGPPGTIPSPTDSAAPSSAPPGETVEITVGTDTGAELKFDPAEVTVPAGADVRLTFENRASVPHNLTFQGLPNVATATIVVAGASETLEFTPPDAGAYAFVCTLHPGMGGTLVVEAG